MDGALIAGSDRRELGRSDPERIIRAACWPMMDSPHPSAVVLVVDDETLIRMYAVDVLEDVGFTVIEADGGEDALCTLDQHPEITVLFTDIHMPGPFDGLVLARKVHERRPDIQLIIASGRGRPNGSELPGDGVFFTKPYDGMAIARLIEATERLSCKTSTP